MTREIGITLCAERHLRCVDQGLRAINAGVAHKCTDHPRHWARRATECGPVDHEPIHVKRLSPGGEVHTGLAAPSGPRERTAVDMSMLRVADGVVPALNTDNTSDAAPVNPIIMPVEPECRRRRSEHEQYSQQLSHTRLLSLVPIALDRATDTRSVWAGGSRGVTRW